MRQRCVDRHAHCELNRLSTVRGRVLMKTGLTIVIVASALALSACKGLSGIADGRDAVCGAAQAWLSADPTVRHRVSKELSSAIDDAEKTTKKADRSSDLRAVLGAGTDLLSGDARKATAAAKKIKKYC